MSNKNKVISIVAVIILLSVSIAELKFNKMGNHFINTNTVANNNIDGNNVYSILPEINEENIYATFSSYSSAAIDFTDRDVVYNKSDLVVVGKIVEKGKSYINKKLVLPYTPGKLVVNKVIKGEIDSKEIDFLVSGGTISINDFIQSSDSQKVAKIGLDKLSDKEKSTKYLRFDDLYTNDFEVNQDYILFLTKSKSSLGKYVVISYVGMIPIDDSTKVENISDISKLPKVKKR